MKQPIKLLLLSISLLLLIGVFPIRAAAANSAELESQLCPALTDRQASITAKLSEQAAKYTNAKQEQNAKRIENRQELDAKIAAARQSANDVRKQAQAALLAKQSSESDKSAVNKYSAAVDLAVQTRRAAFDSARDDFRSSVDDLAGSYTSSIDSRIAALQSTVDTIFSTADTSCHSRRPDTAAARAEFIDGLKQARLSYSDFRRNRQDTTKEIKTLIETRNKAFKLAVQVFQQSMLETREQLKTDLHD